MRQLTRGRGPLESLAFDPQGRLLFTSITQGALFRLEAPDGAVTTVTQSLKSPGGIAVTGAHEAHVGTGNTLTGLMPWLGAAGIARVDLETGAVSQVTTGLAMANGLVRASDGTFYASDDLARSLDRVLPNGTVQRGWLKLNSNGLAISPDQRTLYVNQMIPPKVLAVNRDTGEVSLVADAPEGLGWTWLDGLGIDRQGLLYVASYWSGEVWRLTHDGGWCTLARGLTLPSAVTPGASGAGFSPTSVYVTTHGGGLFEVPGAVPAP
jgi:sugar lactone lactonase YvrE